MRVLQAHNQYQQRGGEDIVVANERQLLIEHGHDVRIWSTSNEAITGFWRKAKVALQVSYSTPARDQMRREIADFKPDIVHVHNFFPLLTPSIYDACRDMGVPVVQTLHNFRTICANGLLIRNNRPCEDCIGASPYQAALHACYRGSRLGSLVVGHMIDVHQADGTWWNKVDRLISLTQFAKSKFAQAGFPPDRIAVKPNFVQDRQLGRPGDQRREGALFVGRLSPEKGIRTLLDAWATLDVPLRVIGGGPLLSLARDRGGRNVVSLGERDYDEVATEMASASFLVFPSEWYETFGLVIIEAFSSGLPVIASRLGAMAEIIEEGVTGMHFTAGDADDLAAKVRWAMAHPEQMLEMGRNARKEYEDQYTAEANLRMLEAIYEDAKRRSDV